MNFRSVKRKCSVRGCKNTDSFAISRVREVGNSVIICKDCLKEGLEAVKNYVPPKKQEHKEPPKLFYNKVAEEIKAEAEPETEQAVKVTKSTVKKSSDKEGE